jgi:uncharacterized OsmC-like protein
VTLFFTSEEKASESNQELAQAIHTNQRAEAKLKEGTKPTELLLAAVAVGSVEPVSVTLEHGVDPSA